MQAYKNRVDKNYGFFSEINHNFKSWVFRIKMDINYTNTSFKRKGLVNLFFLLNLTASRPTIARSAITLTHGKPANKMI